MVDCISGQIRLADYLTAVVNRKRDVAGHASQVSEIKEKIENALRRSAELDASHVTVRAEGGKVILGGTVHAWYERDLAEQAAWSAPGVTEVQDHIEIEPWAGERPEFVRTNFT